MTLLAELKRLRDTPHPVFIDSKSYMTLWHLEDTFIKTHLDDVIALVEAAQYLVNTHKQPNVSIDHYRSYDQVEAALAPFTETRGEDDKL